MIGGLVTWLDGFVHWAQVAASLHRPATRSRRFLGRVARALSPRRVLSLSKGQAARRRSRISALCTLST